MSVWRIGAEAALETTRKPSGRRGGRRRSGPAAGTTATTGKLTAAVDQLTRWIPGDILAIYVAAVTALTAPQSQPSMALLLGTIVATFLFVVLAAFATGDPIERATWAAAILGTIAFAIWALSVPMSGWNRIDFVAENKEPVAVVGAFIGLLFGFFADGVMVRARRK